jgi:cobalt-precorrin 5A hydrolase/precorrin-3B C17-methyltransferase
MLVYYVTESGGELAAKVRAEYPEAECLKFRAGIVEKNWSGAKALVFIMASGIAVRSIAPFIRDKSSDPAVVVMDEKGRHAVSLVGGHEAGANDLALRIAKIVGAEPVITTSTDANRLVAIDVFARKNGLMIENRDQLPRVSSLHIKRGYLNVYNESRLDLPEGFRKVDQPDEADAIISHRQLDANALLLRPSDLVIGIGLNSGTNAREIEEAVEGLIKAQGLSPVSLQLIATHEKKKAEPGLREFAKGRGLELRGFTTGELNSVEGVEDSEAAKKALGVRAVAEPAAILASGMDNLLVKKHKIGNVTLAVCISNLRALYVVGTGPGGLEHMTPEALNTIRESDVVIGFKSYLRLIAPLLEGKEVVSSAMTEEVKRVKKAVELALSGKRVSLISGGDPGVYAMAGLVYEVVGSINAPVDVKVVPGISALNASGARLGAPLMHDFCAISLSDRLTPWDLIEERLEKAAAADFVIALYNPKSKGRKTHIDKAREIILRHRAPTTPVGIVQSAMREDEEVIVTDLQRMLEHEIDMRSTVIIGNSLSFRWHDRLVTPRGYRRKYEI